MGGSRRSVIAAVALLALGSIACENGDPTLVTQPQARFRFVNAIPNAQGNILLTANGTAVGAPLAFGAFAVTCASVRPGSTDLAFGVANAAGTGLVTSLRTLTTQLAAGNFTVIAAGSAVAPELLLFDNTLPTTPPAGHAAIRFVNAVPGTGIFDVFATAPGAALTTPIATNLTLGTANNPFVNVPVTSTQLTFTNAGTTEIAFVVPTQLVIASGDVRTVLLAPLAGQTGFQILTLRPC